MNKSELVESLREIVAPYVQNQEAFKDLSEDTHFIDDLEINSANLVDIILDVEDAYDIEIEDEAMESMLTVKAAIDIIQQKVEAK
jgi:acyl carrier protein